MKEFYAHSIEGKPECEWQLLDEHLLNVAKLGYIGGCNAHIKAQPGRIDKDEL